MKRLIRPAAIVMLVVAITLPAAADKAKSLYNKGKDAEARQNYEQAYDYYKQAYELKPKDIQYRSSYERTRFLAGLSGPAHAAIKLRSRAAAIARFDQAKDHDPFLDFWFSDDARFRIGDMVARLKGRD